MADWWDIYDLDQVCRYPDHVTFNKGEWGRLHALATAGEPGAEQEYLQFKQISATEFEKLRLIASCDKESSVTLDIKGKGQPVGFVPMTPETGGGPTIVTPQEETSPTPLGGLLIGVDTEVEPYQPSGEPYQPSGEPYQPSGELYEPTGGMPEPYEPQGYEPGIGGYPFPESTEDSPGFAIPDAGFQVDGTEVDGALAREEVAPGLKIPVARPERPLVWVGILAATTVAVAGSLYLWGRFTEGRR